MQKKFISFIVIAITFCSCLFSDSLRTLYPEIEPYRTGYLEVDGGHSLYFEECGNPDGKPILFIHGGPGIGTFAYNRSFFDPRDTRKPCSSGRG